MNERTKLLRAMMAEQVHFRHRDEQRKLSILDEDTCRKPFVIRKALALKHMLAEMPIYIQPGELIVGARTLFGLPEYITDEDKANGIKSMGGVLGAGDIFDQPYNMCQDARGYGTTTGCPAGYGNVLNNGLIDNLPAQAVVEVPCHVDANGIRPCRVGSIPLQLAAVMTPHIHLHTMAVAGVLAKDLRQIRQAIAADPPTAAVMTLTAIKDMTAELAEANSQYLQDWPTTED